MNMDDLKALKSKRTTNLQKLQEKAKAQSGGGANRDPRLYKPKLDEKNGANSVRLRFIPRMENQLVEVKSHSFRGANGTYFYQKSRQSLIDENGEPMEDPVNIACKNAYKKRKATGDESYGKIGRSLLPNSRYYANAIVIEDKMQPEREGEVVIFEFGRQLNKIITDAINPVFDDVEPIDPFDLWDGTDFIVRMESKKIPDRKDPSKMVTVPEYKSSGFATRPSEYGTDQEKLELTKKAFDLFEFIDPAKYKSFEELAALFKKAYGKDYRFLDPDYSDVVADAISNPMHDAPPDEPKSEEPASAPWTNPEKEKESGEAAPYNDGEKLTAMEKLQRLQNR